MAYLTSQWKTTWTYIRFFIQFQPALKNKSAGETLENAF